MTQEQKDKQAFFAQYWNQKILKAETNDGKIGTYNIHGSEMHDFFFDYPCWLELKPLTSITDEDAIELANRLGEDYVTVNRDTVGCVWIETPHDEYFLCVEDDGVECSSNSFSRCTILIDFLRSRGYLLPFRSYTTDQLIEMGWAKIEEA